MSEATERYQRIADAVEWERDDNGYISFDAEQAHLRAMQWALMQFSRDEYLDQDILQRLKQAAFVLQLENCDAMVWRDRGVGLHISDVIHDAILEISRLQNSAIARVWNNPEDAAYDEMK